MMEASNSPESPRPASGGAPAADAARPAHLLARLPVYYGWVVVSVAFVTIAIGVNVRTAFSLLYPPILTEFGWDRGETAGIFSAGFVTAIVIASFLGVALNRFGPALFMSAGAVLVSASLALTTWIDSQVALYLSLGCGVVGGSFVFAFTSHAYFLPFWFVRRRGLAVGIAFAGVGVGSILMFPLLQSIIAADGWRDACWAMVILLLAVVLPLNLLLQRRRPEDLGLNPDGDGRPGRAAGRTADDNVVDREWAARDWSLRSAMGTARFWWLAVMLFFSMYAWYAVLVHQTQYLGEVGFDADVAAYALGMVGLMGIAGQIGLGALSDRIGREWAWTLAIAGFGVCYGLLYVMKLWPSPLLLWGMVAAQGVLGYGLAALFPAILAEIFHGRHYGQIYGGFSVIISIGGAAGPWATGEIYDLTGSYDIAWAAALAACVLSAAAVWLAAPGKVRLVAGQVAKRAA